MTAYSRLRTPGLIEVASHIRGTVIGLSDTFNRADSASSLGSTDGFASADPAAWTAASGTWGINGNQAYCPSNTSFGTAWVSSGLSDNITTVTIGNYGDNNHGFMPRYVDNNNYLLILLASYGVYISSYTSGSLTHHVVAGSATTGDTFAARCVGSTIEVFKNGSSTAFLTSTVTEHQTATKQGLFNNGTGTKWENFLVTAP